MYSEEITFYYALLTSSIVLLAFMSLFLSMMIRYHRKRLAVQRDIEARSLAFFEQERERMTFDLHDALGPLITAIHIRLNLLNPPDNHSKSSIDQIKLLLSQTLDRIRDISGNLVPKSLEAEGLLVALKELSGTIQTEHGLPVNIQAINPVPRLQKSRELHLYRVVEEILNNAARHAGATQVFIHISTSPDGKMLNLVLNDDGKGFDLNNVKKKKGLGLRHIIARCELLEAEILWESNQETGTTYYINLPVNTADHE